MMILRGAAEVGKYTGWVIQVVIWVGSIYYIFRLECRVTIKCVNFTKG